MDEETDQFGVPTRYVQREERDAADRKRVATKPWSNGWVVLLGVILVIAYLVFVLSQLHGC